MASTDKNFGPTLEYNEWLSTNDPGWQGWGRTDPRTIYERDKESYARGVPLHSRLRQDGNVVYYGNGAGASSVSGRFSGGDGGTTTTNAGVGGGSGGGTGGGSGGGGGGAGTYNLNPAPRGGNGAYGAVPGPLGLPDPYGDLKRILPGLDNLNSEAANVILSQLKGELSPETINALTNKAAELGVAGGMPGAGTWDHLLLGNIAGGTESLQNQGISNYNATIPTVSRTQTVSPELQADIANTNAINAAAPDPAAAASEAERLYNKYRQSIGGPGGGSVAGGSPAGGTRATTTSGYFPTGGTSNVGTGASGTTPNAQPWGMPDYGTPGPLQYDQPAGPPAPTATNTLGPSGSAQPWQPPWMQDDIFNFSF